MKKEKKEMVQAAGRHDYGRKEEMKEKFWFLPSAKSIKHHVHDDVAADVYFLWDFQ